MRSVFLLLAAAAFACAQIGTPYPGGPPRPSTRSGGGMPDNFPGRNRLPRRKNSDDKAKARSAEKENDPSRAELTALLRRVDEKGVVVEAEDGRLITLLKDELSLKPVPAEIAVGDWVTAVGFVDDRQRWYLREVRFVRKGTVAERERASTPLPVNVFDEVAEESAAKAIEKTSEKPPEPEPEPVAGPSTVLVVLDPTGDDHPRLRRGRPTGQGASASARPASPSASTAPTPTPAPTQTPAPVAAPAPAPAPAVRPPNSGDDAMIVRARASSQEFLNTLPNYLVHQLTTRYQSEMRSGFQPIDQIECDLIVDQGKEHYRDFRTHGKPMKENPSENGSWSAGEFRSLQAMILDRPGITFYNKAAVVLNARASSRYRFTVPRESSAWTLRAESQVYLPAYSGTLWIDDETARVLRIELEARGIPSTFPFNKAETAVDYEFVNLGNRKYLLPTQSAVLSCSTGSSHCTKNTIEFRNYKLFGAQSEISYDDNAPAPALAPASARPAAKKK